MSYELGIIGAGNMAEAIARGVVHAAHLKPSQIIASDVSPHRRDLFANELKIRAVEDNLEVARQSAVVLLSVKPQQMADALAAIGPALSPDALVVSIAAGIGTAFIEQNLGRGADAGASAGARAGPGVPWRVIRTMPNTPMLVGEGMVALARGAHATPEDAQRARRLFEAAADVVEVEERQIDAVTAVSGSGPAYVFYLVEQMIAAGIELGLTPQQARQLAAKTALGAGKMLATTDEPPQDLRRKVTSPGGTTQAAITHLETGGFPALVTGAVKAAARRSKELGK